MHTRTHTHSLRQTHACTNPLALIVCSSQRQTINTVGQIAGGGVTTAALRCAVGFMEAEGPSVTGVFYFSQRRSWSYAPPPSPPYHIKSVPCESDARSAVNRAETEQVSVQSEPSLRSRGDASASRRCKPGGR